MKNRGLIIFAAVFLLFLLRFSSAAEKCEDADGNLSVEEQGFLAGGVRYYSGNYSINFIDWCEQGKVLLEQTCKDSSAETVGVKCKYGCAGGACNREESVYDGETALPLLNEIPKEFFTNGFGCERKIKNSIKNWFEPIRKKAEKEICPNGQLIGNVNFDLELKNIITYFRGLEYCEAKAEIKEQSIFKCKIEEDSRGLFKRFVNIFS